MSNFLICIVGPTAVGKTTKAVELAEIFNTEILSADSRQFYKEMTIGTAVPSARELARVPHHFIQQLSIDDEYTVGDFERQALKKAGELFQKHHRLLAVGGSGLYIKALTEGLDTFPRVNPGLREALNKQCQTKGLTALQNRLKALDPVYAEKVDLNNHRRVIRGLEVCISSGKPYSSFLDQPKPSRPFTTLKIGLRAPRGILYRRIEKRVDHMLSNGLVNEARALYTQRHKNALNTIGYKELFRYFDGEWNCDKAISELKKNTRRFAKRQLTWFRKDQDIYWFPCDCSSTEIAGYIRAKTS